MGWAASAQAPGANSCEAHVDCAAAGRTCEAHLPYHCDDGECLRFLADDRDVEIPMFDRDFGGGGPFTTVVFVFNDCPISACVSFWSKNRVRLGQAFGTMGDSTLVARADDAVARSKLQRSPNHSSAISR